MAQNACGFGNAHNRATHYKYHTLCYLMGCFREETYPYSIQTSHLQA